MSRLRSILKGTRQRRAVPIPLKNMAEGSPDSMTADLRVLGGDDYAEILRYATKFAVDRGGEAKDGNELYDFGKSVAIVATAYVDSDSPIDNPSPFFGTSEHPTLEERASDVLSHPNIGRDTILFLAENSDLYQDECSPQGGRGELSPEDYYKMIAGVAAEGPLAALRLGPATRLKFILFMANLLRELSLHSSTSGPTATSENTLTR
jgi:hypothetical protein